MTFKSDEQKIQAKFKQASSDFSQPARSAGVYNKTSYDFCLPQHLSAENIYSEFRKASIAYFNQAEISWHMGIGSNPTNHMCSSQVCCVNFLYAFVNQPAALKDLLLPIYPDIDVMLAMDIPNHYVEFEWIGKKNYLNEKGKRTRGAYATSADAMVMFQRKNGEKQIVLIEWKYTEYPVGKSIQFSNKGTNRSATYRSLYELDDFPLDKAKLPSFDDLFYEPFDQFMRQQLLANEMEKAHERGADKVSVLHICPEANDIFRRVTSPNLKRLGGNSVEVWQSLLIDTDKFAHVYTEDLFLPSIAEEYPVLIDWWDYITARYTWME